MRLSQRQVDQSTRVAQIAGQRYHDQGGGVFTRDLPPGAPRPQEAQVTTDHPNKVLAKFGWRMAWIFLGVAGLGLVALIAWGNHLQSITSM